MLTASKRDYAAEYKRRKRMIRGHLLNSDVAIVEGSEPESLCAKKIKGCRFVPLPDFMPGERFDRENLSRYPGICRTCLKQEWPRKRLYLAVDGEAAKQMEGGE